MQRVKALVSRPALLGTIALLALASALAISITGSASAKSGDAPAPAFISFGSEVRYHAVTVDLAPSQLGKAAAAVASAADTEPVKEPVIEPVRGDAAVGLDSKWLKTGLGDKAKSGAMPLAARFRSGKCKCATQIGDDKRERVAALYVEKSFSLADDQLVELLELRARYHDGLVIAINGREVIRRNIDGDAEVMDTARRPRGPEIESFFIPVTPGLLSTGENNVRIEVRPSGHRESPILDFELVARRGPRIVRGPIVNRDDDGVTINFDTDLPVTAAIEWGKTAELGQSAATAGGGLAVRHSTRIAAPAGEALHYRIVAGRDTSPTYMVVARPRKGDVVRFGVYGDMRGGHGVHASIVEALTKEAPDFVVVTGDLVLRGSDGGDWQRFFSVARDLLATTPYFPAAGNHDMGRSGEERRLMVEQFPLPPAPAKRPHWASWYSFDVADVHWVMLDSNSYRHDEQLEWLKADLKDAKARGVRAIFAATHDGPFSRGIHRGNRYAARYYAPVLTGAGVTMLFSGHDHLYQRGNADGLDYIVSGGGGAPLYPIRCGIPGKRRCKVDDGMIKAVSQHHYIIASVFKDYVRICPKRPNRDAIEPCIKLDLP